MGRLLKNKKEKISWSWWKRFWNMGEGKKENQRVRTSTMGQHKRSRRTWKKGKGKGKRQKESRWKRR